MDRVGVRGTVGLAGGIEWVFKKLYRRSYSQKMGPQMELSTNTMKHTARSTSHRGSPQGLAKMTLILVKKKVYFFVKYKIISYPL